SMPGDIAEFLSPCIALSGAHPKLEFAYHLYGAGIGELHVDLQTDEGIITDILPVLSGSKQRAMEDDFKLASVDLSDYIGQTIKVIFRAVRGSGWDGDIAIDDIQITGNGMVKPITNVKKLDQAKI